MAVFALSPALAAKQITLRIPLEPGPEPEEIAVATFDDSRILPADLKRWMLVHENGYYETLMIESSTDCKPSDIPKLQQGIRKTQQMIDELDPSRFPLELSGVVMYLKDLQSFRFWQSVQELEFLKSGKAPQDEYTDTDLERCQVHVETLSRVQACHQVFFNWHNCVLHTLEKQLGSYPKDKWKAFLDAYGIQERIESTIGD